MVRLLVISLFCVSICYGQANRFAGFGSRNTCPTEALVFIDSTNITDTVKIRSICTLVKQLQDSSLWNLYDAIYTYIDTTANVSKFNLKNPSQYISSFVGGCTFSSFGVLFNGTNAYQNTFINPSTVYTKGDLSYSILINGGSLAGAPYPTTIGASVVNGTDDNVLVIRTSGKFFIPNGQSNPFAISSNTATTGFFTGTVKSSSINLLKDGVVLGTNTITASGSLANTNIYVGALGGSLSSITYQNARVGIVLIGKGKTVAQSQTEYNIINTFKTTLGR